MKRNTAKALTVATSLAVAGAVAGSGAFSSDVVTTPAVESAAYVVTPASYHTAAAFAPRTDNRATFAERASRDAANRAARIKKLEAAKAKSLARAKALEAKREAAARKASVKRAQKKAQQKAQKQAQQKVQQKAQKRVVTTRPVTQGSARSIGKRMAAQRGWTGYQWVALDKLWTAESGWGVSAGNASGAYGIPQALPGSKMASAGSNWRTSAATQIEWGLNYIDSRWGSPSGAWNQFQSAHWY